MVRGILVLLNADGLNAMINTTFKLELPCVIRKSQSGSYYTSGEVYQLHVGVK